MPRSHVSVYVGFLGSSPAPACELGSEAAACAVVQLLAFDSSGHQIASSSPATVTQGRGVQTQLSVSTASAQIVGFEITARNPTDNQKDVAIDDLSFDTPSQPPASGLHAQHADHQRDGVPRSKHERSISIGRIGSSSGQIQLTSARCPPASTHSLRRTRPTPDHTDAQRGPDGSSSAGTITITGTPLSASAGSSPRTLTLNVRVESACDDVLNGQDLVDALGSGCQRIYIDDQAHDRAAWDRSRGYISPHANSTPDMARSTPTATRCARCSTFPMESPWRATVRLGMLGPSCTCPRT